MALPQTLARMGPHRRAAWLVFAGVQGVLLWAIGLNWWQMVVVILSGRFFAGALSELEA